MRERNRLDAAVSGYLALQRDYSDNMELLELAEADDDQGMVADAESALKRVKEQAAEQELKSLLNGEADGNDCYLEINAGPAAPRARTGPRCSTGCTPAGRRRADSSPS